MQAGSDLSERLGEQGFTHGCVDHFYTPEKEFIAPLYMEPVFAEERFCSQADFGPKFIDLECFGS